MTFDELQALVLDLQQQIAVLNLKMGQNNEFEQRFSDKIIINKDVQFLKKVTRKNGSTVTQINP